jgi:hypothetical protein
LIMDSGTFTLNNGRRTFEKFITFKGYKSYLKLFADKVDFYFNFDDDFSADGFEHNYTNQLDLESEGYKPVPVIHNCYSEEIDTYIEAGYTLVSIGSGELEKANQDELYRIVNSIHKRGVKVHYLGCTEYEKMAYIPVYSADSTTWNRKGASGRIRYWNPLSLKDNKTDVIALDHKVPKQNVKYRIRTYKFSQQFKEYLWNELGLTIDEIIRGKKRYIYRAVVNIHYFVLLEELINQKHKEQGFSFE